MFLLVTRAVRVGFVAVFGYKEQALKAIMVFFLHLKRGF
jgi:hypothetical protein